MEWVLHGGRQQQQRTCITRWVTASFVKLYQSMSQGTNKSNNGKSCKGKCCAQNYPPWPAEKKRTGAAAGAKVRGMALKTAGAALLAEVREAANTARRTANAAMREMDCIMEMRARVGCSAAFKCWRSQSPAFRTRAHHTSHLHLHPGPPLSPPQCCHIGLEGWEQQQQRCWMDSGASAAAAAAAAAA